MSALTGSLNVILEVESVHAKAFVHTCIYVPGSSPMLVSQLFESPSEHKSHLCWHYGLCYQSGHAPRGPKAIAVKCTHTVCDLSLTDVTLLRDRHYINTASVSQVGSFCCSGR